MRREAQDSNHAIESEVERRHENTVAQRVREAETVHAEEVVIAFRKELKEATLWGKTLEIKAADLDNHGAAMGDRVLEPTNGETALPTRRQALQDQQEDVVEHGRRTSVIRARDRRWLLVFRRRRGRSMLLPLGTLQSLDISLRPP